MIMTVLEVSRRILRKEEGSQSIYKINGKEMRARDVQLLFADASTGANSPALVRQGQISELINAKPQNRRKLLEEAAGITGLYTRRHEAELRLRAAETNLERLDDVTGELETQRATLARQARQATRYRNLSGDIRRTEAYSAWLRWQEASEALAESEARLAEISTLLEEATRVAAAATSHQAKAHETLEPLRQKEAEAAAALHRLNVAMEGLDEELARARAEGDRLQAEKEQLERDIARERDLGADAEQALEQLGAEEAQLQEREAAESDRLQHAEQLMHQSAEQLAEAEAAFERKNTEAAEHEAERRAITQALEIARGRLDKLTRELTRLEEERRALKLSDEEEQALVSAQQTRETADQALTEAETRASAAEDSRTQATEREEALRQPKQKAAQALAELQAEADTISRILDTGAEDDFSALIEAVTVETGYENALAAALGDELNAALEDEAATHWSGIGGQPLISPALPEGAQYLSGFVTAPPALARRLASIGVVEAEDGARLQAQLMPGQRLVSLDGDLWRWDGYVQKADARTAAAIRLEQRNRLVQLKDDISHADERLKAAAADHDAAVTSLQEAARTSDEARQALQGAQRTAREAQQRFVDLEKKHERTHARLGALAETLERLTGDRQEAESLLAEREAALQAQPDIMTLKEDVNSLRAAMMRCRSEASETRAAWNDRTREANTRATRLQGIARERGVWKTRGETAMERIAEVSRRLEETAEALSASETAPQQIEEKRKSLFDQIEGAESRRRNAADELTAAQTAANDADKAVREADAEAVEAREARARLEAQLEAGRERVTQATDLARENCDSEPEKLLEVAEHKEGKDLPTREEIERKLERYKRERENLGGVNLRADEEMEEIDQRLTEMTVEREDCEAAIRKLRSAIGNLNREGRQRLLDAFTTVNENFQKLFVRLFGGGSAELRLVDSEDPLEAGLEIFASPPGKKLTSMSLMSGGEQAMTATALIFAVFMANPAPVCVLDEVDAPLDDANVERFCQMLQDMAQETETRFIIITHHALTMSRMDRLYGVTMIERGVSQLVSVDLTSAEQLVAAE